MDKTNQLEEKVNKVVDTVTKMNELDTYDKDVEILAEVIGGVVRKRLGDISVDAVGVSRSAGEQAVLIENCAKSYLKDIEKYINVSLWGI